MSISQYRITRKWGGAGAGVLLLCLFAGLARAPAAGSYEEELARSLLNEVEGIARKSADLESFGKTTLSQSAAILEVGNAALPPLLEKLKRSKEWKMRFWAADILAYLGGAEEIQPLAALVKNGKERMEVRLRAIESIASICRRAKNGEADLRRILPALKRGLREAGLRQKIDQILARPRRTSGAERPAPGTRP